jgi:hypothetical protein
VAKSEPGPGWVSELDQTLVGQAGTVLRGWLANSNCRYAGNTPASAAQPEACDERVEYSVEE